MYYVMSCCKGSAQPDGKPHSIVQNRMEDTSAFHSMEWHGRRVGISTILQGRHAFDVPFSLSVSHLSCEGQEVSEARRGRRGVRDLVPVERQLRLRRVELPEEVAQVSVLGVLHDHVEGAVLRAGLPDGKI